MDDDDDEEEEAAAAASGGEKGKGEADWIADWERCRGNSWALLSG